MRNSNTSHGLPLSSPVSWIYARPRLFPLVTDLLAIAIGWSAAWLYISFRSRATDLVFGSALLLIVIGAHITLGLAAGLYRGRWRVASFDEVTSLLLVATAWPLIGMLLARAESSVDWRLVLIAGVLAAGFQLAIRLGWRKSVSYTHLTLPTIYSV